MLDEREIGNRVKGSVIGIIKGSGEITQTAVQTVAATVQATGKEAGETGAAAATLAVGAVTGVIDATGEVAGVTASTAADGASRWRAPAVRTTTSVSLPQRWRAGSPAM